MLPFFVYIKRIPASCKFDRHASCAFESQRSVTLHECSPLVYYFIMHSIFRQHKLITSCENKPFLKRLPIEMVHGKPVTWAGWKSVSWHTESGVSLGSQVFLRHRDISYVAVVAVEE